MKRTVEMASDHHLMWSWTTRRRRLPDSVDPDVRICLTHASDFTSERTRALREEVGDMMSEWTPFKTPIMKTAARIWKPEGGHCLSWRQPNNLAVQSNSEGGCHAGESDLPNLVGLSESRLSMEVLADQKCTAVVTR